MIANLSPTSKRPSFRQSLRSLAAGTSPALALTLALSFMGGCNCPEPVHVERPPERPENVQKVEATFAAAESKKVWTPADQEAFSLNIANLAPDTAFRYAKRLAQLVNTKAIRLETPPPTSPPPPTCPCTPGLCATTTTTTQTPTTSSTPATPATTSAPPAIPPPATGPRTGTKTK